MKPYVALLASLALLTACGQQGANAPAGFRLPPGNFEAGRKAYLAGRIPRKLYATASSPLTGLIE